MPERLPHVALLIETSRSYGRGVLRGVRRYLAEHGPWSVYLETRALDSEGPPWLKNWQGDGILTRTGSAALARVVRAARVPTIELRTPRFGGKFPWVGVDNRALGQRVAEHLLERGFRRFGVCALDTEVYFRERCANFISTVRERGFPCDVFAAPPHAEHPAEWEQQQEELTQWLHGLAKPVGLMACTDQLGFWLLDACKRAGAAVPEEIAVVGVENDESLCAMASPPLSSVALNTEKIGYVAAQLLDRMMGRGRRGRRRGIKDTFIEPLGIVTRQSSDVVAVEDEMVSAALRFIRENACAGIRVADVLDAVPVSRSKLERDFRDLLGRSPNDEIRRVQLERARQLLVETDLSLSALAERTGFSRAEYLCAVFKEEFGQTPGGFRASARPRP